MSMAMGVLGLVFDSHRPPWLRPLRIYIVMGRRQEPFYCATDWNGIDQCASGQKKRPPSLTENAYLLTYCCPS